MITKQQAELLSHGAVLHHTTMKNADRTPLRVRVSGRCVTWKTRPNEFRLPVKHGLRDHGYIDQRNATEWEVA